MYLQKLSGIDVGNLFVRIVLGPERIKEAICLCHSDGRHSRRRGKQGKQVGELWLLAYRCHYVVPAPVEVGCQ